jgi:hypothetical protein
MGGSFRESSERAQGDSIFSIANGWAIANLARLILTEIICEH